MDNVLTYRTADQINSSMARVYGYMSLAVLLSGLVSLFVASNPFIFNFFFTGFMHYVTIFLPLIFGFFVIFKLRTEVSLSTAQSLLYGFAAVMGLSISGIFLIFKLGSVFSAFMGGSILFLVLSLYGYFTKTDLTRIGQFLFLGLIAIIIASLINIFVGNSLAATVISAVALVIFLGFTAYNTQQIREMVSYDSDSSVEEVKGALTLYLDFVNIFMSLLQLFGERNE